MTENEDFARRLRALQNLHDLNIIEAIMFFCETEELDIDDVLPLLDETLTELIRETAINERMVLGFEHSKLF